MNNKATVVHLVTSVEWGVILDIDGVIAVLYYQANRNGL